MGRDKDGRLHGGATGNRKQPPRTFGGQSRTSTALSFSSKGEPPRTGRAGGRPKSADPFNLKK